MEDEQLQQFGGLNNLRNHLMSSYPIYPKTIKLTPVHYLKASKSKPLPLTSLSIFIFHLLVDFGLQEEIMVL